MTYFGFLLRFLVIPIIGLLLWLLLDRARGKDLPPALRSYPAWLPIAALVVVAVTYTTPWDNYLVATGIWSYKPELVTGWVIGYVPIEEYTFFVLQPIFTGLWLLTLGRYLPASAPAANPARVRTVMTGVLAVVWVVALALLLGGWKPGTYLNLLLVWALPPLMLQTAFGADLLWKHRWLFLLTLIPASIYLSFADALAIDGGTWTIAPETSLHTIKFAGILPLEEAIFFFMTNLLITVAMLLLLSVESRARVPQRLRRWLLPRSEASI